MDEEHQLVVVHMAPLGSAGLVKGLLEEAGIAAYLQDEMMSTIYPVGPVRVAVVQQDVERAKTIIEQFLKENPSLGDD